MNARPRFAGVATVALVGTLALSACQRGVPFIDTAPAAAQGDATITGTVRVPEGNARADGRTVEAVNIATGERQRVSTNTAGGFSFKLQPGKYRVQLMLKGGEALVSQPGLIELNTNAVEAAADFVVDTVRISRPRGPAYRTDDGLGSPIA